MDELILNEVKFMRHGAKFSSAELEYAIIKYAFPNLGWSIELVAKLTLKGPECGAI